MRKKVLLFSMLLLCLTLVLCACSDKKRQPSAIFLESNSLRASYEVDATFSEEGASLRLVYANGDTETIRCDSSMIVGFDTSTTGQKALHATYMGLDSNEITYTVYNPEGVSREILTRTRISVAKTVTTNGKTMFFFRFTGADADWRALTFKLQGSVELSETLWELTCETPEGMDECYVQKTAANGVNILISGSPIVKQGIFFTLTWEKDNVDISLSDITVSDGIKDYYLPKAQ